MSARISFVIVLAVLLALLAGGAYYVARLTLLEWAAKDMRLRAELAVNGARRSLVRNWGGANREHLEDILEEFARDERIMAAAACSAALRPLAATRDYPKPLACRELIRDMPRVTQPGNPPPHAWYAVDALPTGTVHVSAIPVLDRSRMLGYVVLVQDLSYADRRDADTRVYLLLLFGLLAGAASLTTIVAARLAWRGWSNELRRLLRGEAGKAAFRPFLRDVRELVDRVMEERELDGEAGLWTPQRLKNALNRHLHGEKIVIVANREPYIHEHAEGGVVKVINPASGLVTALEPVMRACSGVWVAHGGGSADRDTVDAHDHVRVPPGEESYLLRRIWLSPEEEKGYYYGFSNEGLWPLCHVAHTRPVFRGEDWKQYQAVNRKFADAVASEVDSEDPIVMVQDYHFALAPRMIRERLPRATVITFWHIPWPNAERFGICPWREELLEGVLGSSIVGFHTQSHCINFLESADRYLESRIDRERSGVVRGGRTALVRPYPISLEWPPHWARTAPPVADCRKQVVAELNLPPGTLLGVGVDRLDYTKGIEERLLTVERLLERFPEYRGKFVFIQLAAPSRVQIERYRLLNESVEAVTARINERFAQGSYRPIVLLRRHHQPPDVFKFYRAADVCYVSSLHDGMNLVAKEFVAAREDDRGVLLLSQFTGAARELTEALIVNPYDLDEASSGLATALTMSGEEQSVRMRSMRRFVAEFNVYRWAGRMIADAARMRSHDRLAGRLTGRTAGEPVQNRT
jgi:trehalose 6-phosphate synthase